MSVFKIFRGLIPFKKVSGGLDAGKHQLHSQHTLRYLNTLSGTILGLSIKDNSENAKTDILSKFTKLRSLTISCRFVHYINILKKLEYLENVCIYDTPLKSLEMLRNHEKIRNLTLKNTYVADLEPLKNCPNLMSLRLEGNRYLTKQQIESLRKMLPKCEIKTF